MKRRSFWAVCAALVAAPWKCFGSSRAPAVAERDVESMETLLGLWADECVRDARCGRIDIPDFSRCMELYSSGVSCRRAVVASRIPEGPGGALPIAVLMDVAKDKATEAIGYLTEIAKRHDGCFLLGTPNRSRTEFELERRKDDPTMFRMRLTVNYRVPKGRDLPDGWERMGKEA